MNILDEKNMLEVEKRMVRTYERAAGWIGDSFRGIFFPSWWR